MASLAPQPHSAHPRLAATERRQQLVDVAIDLFSRKGFNGTTTREIAAAAGVTEAIIFRHFKTKQQLYSAIVDQRLSSPEATAWISGFQTAMKLNDDEAVVRTLIEAVITTHKDPKFERLMLYAALEGHEIGLLYMRQITASIADNLRGYVVRRQKAGKFQPMNPDIALTAVTGMAKHYALNKYIHSCGDPSIDDEQAVESFTRIAMNGLCTKTK
jgi:TetR/AcrR family transcriptional regulator